VVDHDERCGPNRVRTEYEEHGRAHRIAPPVVLLHGGLVGGVSWRAQLPAFAATHHVFVPDRRGHGRTPDVDGAYSYEAMAEETIQFLEDVVRRPAHLVGFSDGGNVALHVARDRPELVDKLVVVGANFHHDGLHPAFTAGLRGEPDAPEWVRAIHLPVTGPPPAGCTPVVAKVEQMWTSGPTMTVDSLERIEMPVLVMVGDDDCISYAHTVRLFESLPRGQLAVVPGTSHLVLEEKPALANAMILDFLADGRPRRLLPMRFSADRH
jgi:pimeloyl-ACP methyl ester carboxylesterase